MRIVRASMKVLVLAAVLAAVFPSPALSEKPLSLGVHPFLPSTELVKKFGPLAEYLSREMDRPVQVEISRDYGSHVDSVGEGVFDIAYMGPASYVRLVEKYGEVPLLGRLEIRGKPTFRGVIFVREDSPVRNVEDLAGRSAAFVTKTSTMGFIVPWYVMRQSGVRLEQLTDHKFLKNHDNVALAVLAGSFDAGAVKEETYEKYAPQGARAVAMTPPLSEHLFVMGRGKPPEIAEAVREALLGIASTHKGLKALQTIKRTATGIVPVENRDYDLLRDILRGVDRNGSAP